MWPWSKKKQELLTLDVCSSSMSSDWLVFGGGLAQGSRNGAIRSLPKCHSPPGSTIHLGHQGDGNVHVFSLNLKCVMLSFGDQCGGCGVPWCAVPGAQQSPWEAAGPALLPVAHRTPLSLFQMIGHGHF